jgi:hypothetical protein
MALTLERLNLVKQRCRMDAHKPGIVENLRALWKHMEQAGQLDMQFLPIYGADITGAADVVLANVPCKLYALVLEKPAASTVDVWSKISNHTSATEAHGDIVVNFVGTGGGGRTCALIFPDGHIFSAGATFCNHTANDGTTRSARVDAPVGFAIVGAA